MKLNIRGHFKTSFLFIASIFGAGFASGQEILSFFTKYDGEGTFGLVIVLFLFALMGYSLVDYIKVKEITSYHHFLNSFLSDGWANFFRLVSNVFTLVFYCAMISGSSAILHMQFKIPIYIASFMMSLIVFLIIDRGSKSIEILSTVITPVLLLYCVFCLGISAISDSQSWLSLEGISAKANTWFGASLVYVGYNFILSAMLLTGVLKNWKKDWIQPFGALLGGVFLGVTALIFHQLLLSMIPEILKTEIPILYILKDNTVSLFVMQWIIFAAMVTTAINTAFCLKQSIVNVESNRWLFFLIVILVSVLFSDYGFSTIVSYVYPVFGVGGIILFGLFHFKNFSYMIQWYRSKE